MPLTAHRSAIADNDVPNEVTIAATTDAAEPDSNGAFAVSIGNAAQTDTIVSYTVAGTATAGADYVALSGTVDDPGWRSIRTDRCHRNR